jgi:hypothetical protein
MNRSLALNDLPSYFVAMEAPRRLLFLAIYSSEITILERGYFVDKNYEAARLCNESIHRIAGYMASLLSNPEAAVESAFMEMLIQGARQKGWSQILVRSLEMSL